MKYYDEKNQNPYCFFQPPSLKEPVGVTLSLIDPLDTLPSPMEKHRVPTLRLVPPGSLK